MKNIILILVIIVSNLSYGQENTQNIMELKNIGRDTLISMAVDQINDNESFTDFNKESFNSIKVCTEDSNLYVLFSMAVLYAPINSSYIYSITVNLMDGSISWSSLTNPKGNEDENSRTFYTPGLEQEKALKFIYETGKAPENNEVTIFDHPEYYEVEEIAKTSALYYKISKTDKKIFDETYEEIVNEDEMKHLYFISPEKSVEIISDLLRNEEWKTLTSYYYQENCRLELVDSMLSGEYFIRKNKPEVSHPGGFWKYKNPFPPGFKYSSHEELYENIVKINLTIEIDQGNNNVQVGAKSYQLIKLKEGYQLVF